MSSFLSHHPSHLSVDHHSININDKAAQAGLEFPQLRNKSQEDLEDLLNDSNSFETFFDSLPHVQAITQNEKQLWHDNTQLAIKISSREEELQLLRNEVKFHHNEMKNFQNQWEELDKEQYDILKRFQPNFLLSRMKNSINDDDQVSESLVTGFLEGKLDANEWIKQYRDLRKIYHLKAAVVERWEKGGIVGME